MENSDALGTGGDEQAKDGEPGILRHVGDRPRGLVIAFAVNWLIKPFTMAGPGVVFFEVVFRDLIDPAAAPATVVGVLVEVPVMLSLVALANRTRHLFHGAAPKKKRAAYEAGPASWGEEE